MVLWRGWNVFAMFYISLLMASLKHFDHISLGGWCDSRCHVIDSADCRLTLPVMRMPVTIETRLIATHSAKHYYFETVTQFHSSLRTNSLLYVTWCIRNIFLDSDRFTIIVLLRAQKLNRSRLSWIDRHFFENCNCGKSEETLLWRSIWLVGKQQCVQ